MKIQISSGQGPAECELAVVKLFHSLKAEYKDIELISKHAAKTNGCCTSITFRTKEDLSFLEGTVQWICQSPFRPYHKRKNWFMDVSVIPEDDEEQQFSEKNIVMERFHCGGNGGQNVNKVETGVRLIHKPTGIAVTSTRERTQKLNRSIALKKLQERLENVKQKQQEGEVNNAWKEHNRIIRGNPVRIYQGISFVRRA